MNLRVLVWNIRGRGKRPCDAAFGLLPELIDNYQPSLITLIEAPDDAGSRLRKLGVEVRLPERTGVTKNPRGLLTFGLDAYLSLKERSSARHYRAYEASLAGHEPLTLVTVHLQSPLYDKGEPEHPRWRANKCREFVEATETDARHTRTVLFGDFNMDPFASAMVSLDGLNAMSTAVRARKVRKFDDTDRAAFYNPMWSMFGDRPPSPDLPASPAGTYYLDEKGPAGYFWHMPDQVLLRAQLSAHLTELGIVDEVGSTSLVHRKTRRPSVSDHLPVLFELNESVWKRSSHAT